MSGWEAGALAVGRAVVRRAAASWLAQRNSARQRSSELSELIGSEVSDWFKRRTLERQMEEIADSVAQRLAPLCRHEFRDLDDHERAAALQATVDAFAVADLSDKALFAADMDPAKLVRALQASSRHLLATMGLGESATFFYDLVLAECCDCYVRIVIQLAAFGPRASVEMLDRLSRIGEQVSLVLARLPARRLDGRPDTDPDDDFERRYLEVVSDRLDQLELFGVDVPHYRPRTTLSIAYISLTATAASTEGDLVARRVNRPDRRWLAEHWHDALQSRDTGGVRVETALGAGPRILVRGEAGSGKTTLLAWLAVTAARGHYSDALSDWNGCVPFLVRLRSHAEGPLPRPEDFLDGTADSVAGLMPTGWVHRVLDAGRGLLLIDGVDELPSRKRRAIRDWLSSLVTAYPTARILVTARPGAANADWLTGEGFVSLMLEPMGPADIRSLIRHWHDAARDAGNLPCPASDLPRYEASLFAQLDTMPHLRALAANPLLCAMLCALNLNRRTHLPRDRMSVYAAAVNLLLDRRDVERGIPEGDLPLTMRDKVSLLQDLAWRLSLNNAAELPTGRASAHIASKIATMPHIVASADDVLTHLVIRSGVIREPVHGRIDFIHRTIQEYLTAKEIAEEAHIGLLLDRAHLDLWADIVIMTAGHANTPLRVQLLTGILEHADQHPAHFRRMTLLAGACLDTALTLPEDLHDRIDQGLAALLPPSSVRATRSLAAVGKPILHRLPKDLDGLSEAAAAASVRTAALINGPEALTILAGYATDPRRRVQRELARAWKYFDPHDYAQHVLADAPLNEGALHITDPVLLQAAHHLGNLEKLYVELDAAADVNLLRGLPAVTSVRINSAEPVDVTPLAEHTAIRHLRLVNADTISGVDILRSLHELRSLWLPAVESLPDITFLSATPLLEDLWLGDIATGADLSPLSALPNLTHLNFLHRVVTPDIVSDLPKLKFVGTKHGGQINASVDALAGLPALTDLGLWDCSGLSNISALAELNLTCLRLLGAEDLTDITPLASLINLKDLILEQSSVTDLTPIAHLRNLRSVNLWESEAISDLAPLGTLSKLRHLYLGRAAPDLDLSPLAGRRGLHIWLTRGQNVRGLDRLRSAIHIHWQ